jgi:hypothetical protein
MKHGLHKINIRLFTKKWGGFVVKELNSIFGAQGSNFTNDIYYGQHWNIDRIFYTYLYYLS